MSEPRYRIAFVTTQADSMGGSHVHVRDLSTALAARGHQVCVMVGGEGPFIRQLQERGIDVVPLRHMVRPISPAQDVRAIAELRQKLREFSPDLVSAHSSKAGLLARIAGWSRRIPTLFTAHGWSFAEGIPERQRRVYIAAERSVRRISPLIVCVAEGDRALGVKEGVASSDQIIVIYNAMPDSPERANPTTQPPRIVSVARLDEQKDHPTLLCALAEVRDRAWQLDLVGGGARADELRDLAHELGLAERVHFHGTQTDVRPFLRDAQIFALISNWEGFPRSTLEAMRTGLPVVVSDLGGSREAFEEGVSGYSVPPRDIARLTEVLRDLIDHPEKRARMGQAARQRYEELFTFDRLVQQTEAAYAELLARAGQRKRRG